jgi:nitrite reductase/ring-hydroxylating ferredoxin subunit
MEFMRVASTAEVPAGKMKKVNVRGKDVLIANVDGVYCALSNTCPHFGGSLADGTLHGNVVTCPRHGAQFDLKTGAAVGKAKVVLFRMMPKNAESYETKVEGTDVMVNLP